MKNVKSSKLTAARKMPPQFHSIPGEPFCIEKSQVIKWLISQPDILQYLFDKVSHDYLIYNRETGKWQGEDYGN